MGRRADKINHKEFITWREFMNYFYDYRDIEDRNKRTKEAQKTRETIQEERTEEPTISLLEQEKERRLKELPKLRPADQIDISEKQL